MKIEISKKHIIVAAISIAIVALSFTGGWFFGVNSTKNPKGNGEDFFVEVKSGISDAASETLIYHSTVDCPNIKGGVLMNSYGYSYEYDQNKIYPYYFCSQCMDNELISDCRDRIIRAFNAQKGK